MTDKNEKALTENTDNSADESSLNSPKEDISNAAQPAPHNESKASNTLPAAALLVGVVAIGLSGWQYYQSHIVNNHQSTITATENKVVALEQQLSRIDRNVESNTRLTRRISDINDTVTATQAEAKALQSHTEQALIDISSKINKLSNADKNDWLLAEAEYLIRLANQRLLLDKDTRSAISLLSNADTILAGLEDPLMFATRKAVAQDIQALKSVTSFDIEGRYLQLSALYDQVATLPQREPSKAWLAQQASAEAAPDQTSSSAIKQLLQEAWQGIKSLVVINYDQKPIKPLLPPAEYQELVTGIQLQLD
ncbi:MAG: uroporphyrinogen-III C-methyltransferase, partial [Pseudomonadota bacterium]|nr:uroporphyrinogen-III C-methyltransferase [Pseudomonadota bacterium]